MRLLAGLPFCLVFLAISALAQERAYRLEACASSPAIQVDGNTQIILTLSGLKVADLTKTPPQGLDPGREVLLRGYIGYSPKTPGIKKIGPFELEFQGAFLRSETVMVEAVPGWPPEDGGYQFQVFPRTVVKGQPVTVTFRQKYSGEPLVNTATPAHTTTIRFKHQANGERLAEVECPPKSWTSAGSSAMQINGRTFQTTDWRYEISTTKTGKISITREDLPPLPADIIFQTVEVEVVEKMDETSPSLSTRRTLPMGAKEARLAINVQPRTIMLGENFHLGVSLGEVKVANLGANALPEVPQPYEWSKAVQFYADLEFTPAIPGEKTFGPFTVEFQGEKLVSNSQSVEVLPEWPRDAERYEFRVFPRRVPLGAPIRITYREQYSGKPRFDIPYHNPRDPNPKLWSSPGTTKSWRENGRNFSRIVSTFDLPSSKVGKMMITRETLPPMDPAINFEPLEVEIIEPK